jgi:hypothetical protein
MSGLRQLVYVEVFFGIVSLVFGVGANQLAILRAKVKVM